MEDPTKPYLSLSFRHEAMGPHFTKFYLEGLPVPAVLHRFTEAEPNADPHDHPWSFVSLVISGGYEEEIFWRDGSFRRVTRYPGERHYVTSGTIHRITRLLSEECWTLILPGPPERIPGFYRWDNSNRSAFYRPWNESEFKPLEAKP